MIEAQNPFESGFMLLARPLARHFSAVRHKGPRIRGDLR
jgi:hypothetical protein